MPDLSSYARITKMQTQSRIGQIALNDPKVTALENTFAREFIKLGSHVGVEQDLAKVTRDISHLETIRIAIDTANKSAPIKVNLAKLADPAQLSATQIEKLKKVDEVRESLVEEFSKVVKEINSAPEITLYLANPQAAASIQKQITAQQRKTELLRNEVKALEEQTRTDQKQSMAAYKEVYNPDVFPRQVTPEDLASSIKKAEPTAKKTTPSTSVQGPAEGKTPGLG